MSGFNSKKVNTPNAISFEGGDVYTKSPIDEWINFLFSSYLEDRFYEKASSQINRYLELTDNMAKEYGYNFIAKAAVFARNELGMRSVAQLTAAWLNNKNFDNKRNFYKNFCHRPDDVAEIFAAIDFIKQKRSHAVVRGCGDYLSSLSAYSLGKYKLNRKDYNMYDLINITHAHSDVIDSYKRGILEKPDTWEIAISTAKDGEDRNQEWKRLVEEKRLGYLALIRNIRNILNSGVDRLWIATYLVPQLTDEDKIQKSLVFPYQIYSAYKNVGMRNTIVDFALEEAFIIAIKNMPKLEGDTAIILDISGSMSCPISAKSNITIAEAGAVYATAIMHTNPESVLIKFGDKAKVFKFNQATNLFDNIRMMVENEGLGHGTNLASAYWYLDKHYDRIMLISDMQIMTLNRSYLWLYDESVKTSYQQYCKDYGRCKLYSFELGGYHTQTDNPNNNDVYLCTSLSEKIMKFIQILEQEEDIVDYINNYNY